MNDTVNRKALFARLKKVKTICSRDEKPIFTTKNNKDIRNLMILKRRHKIQACGRGTNRHVLLYMQTILDLNTFLYVVAALR